MSRFVLLPLAALLLSPPPLPAQQVGDTVFVSAAKKATLKHGSRVVGTVPRGNHLRVDDINGDWYWVTWTAGTGTPRGWVHRRDILPVSQALEFFDAALRRNPTGGDYHIRGMIWDEKGEIDIALGDYNEAIRLAPKFASAYNSRGVIWRKKRQYDKAIVDYNEAIRLDPKYALAHYNRGNAWSDKGEYDKAIADYNEAIRIDPEFAFAHYARGVAWSDQEEYDKAIADYNEALRLDPKYAWAYFNRGSAWSNKGNCGKAISDYEEAIRVDPKHARACNGLAWLLATCPDSKLRDGKKAIEAATKACELTDWTNADHVDTLAAAYAEAGDFDNAVKWQTKAVELTEEANKADFSSRLELYRAKTPYREEGK
jgi:tetratricopeptide (TPR) repeat protein